MSDLFIVADICSPVDPAQKIRAIAMLEEPEYDNHVIRLGTFHLHSALKLAGGASAFISGNLFIQEGQIIVRDVFVDLDALGDHPVRLSAGVQEMVVRGLYLEHGKRFTPLLRNADVQRLLASSRIEK